MNKPAPHPEPRGKELFGEVAVRKGFVTAAHVREALAIQKDIVRKGEPHKLIGMILLEMGALGTTELIESLRDMNVLPRTAKTTRRVVLPP